MSEVLKGLKRFENDFRLAGKIELLMSQWTIAYPHVDLKSQIQWAHSWLESNPTRAKKDNVRFLNMWMKNTESRFQEKRQNERRGTPLPPPPRHEIPESEIVTGEMFAPLKEELLRIKWRKRTE